MDDFFKYLTPGVHDINWGLYLNVAGKATIKAGIIHYPPPNHPNEYFISWEKGRILNEYQINYITKGEGVYENETGKYKVKAGALMITKPGSWHRYLPHKNTGWVENYVGFNGSIANQLFNNPAISGLKPVFNIGSNIEIIDTYLKIYEYIKEEKPGYQQVSAGMVMKLLGYIVAIEKQRGFSETRIEDIIKKACFLIRENLTSDFDLKEFAEGNNIGYSYLRKMFKKYTGVPPVQYQLDLKIMRSREILLSTNKPVKEISYELGFQSAYYFSRAFKKKMGVSPSSIRVNP